MLLLASFVLLLIASVVAFLSKRSSYILSAIGSTLLIYLSIATTQFDPLTRYFMLISALVWLSASIYSIEYDEYGNRLSACFALTIVSMVLVLTSRDAITFLVGWEGMTITSFLAISAKRESSRAAYSFLAFGELSTLLLLLSFALGFASMGSIHFNDWSGSNVLNWILLAAILGFGVKMAIFPFHIWLPPAHATAPSNISALLSAVLTLMGVYGILKMLSIATPPLWISVIILTLGAVTAAIGALFAATSERVKELPAYSTIENDGIIFILIGAYIIALYHNNSVLAAFSIISALFFAFSHSIAKAMLFLVAGLVERSASNFIELQKARLSRIAVLGGYVSALSLAAIPPFPGFISEWMALETLFQSFEIHTEYKILVLLVGAVVALAAGISTISMSKMISFGFQRVENERIRVADLGFIILLSTIVLLCALPQLVLRFFSPIVNFLAGVSPDEFIGGALDIPKGYLIISGKGFGGISPTFVFVFLLAFTTILYVLTKRRYRLTNPWNGGYGSESYNSLAYSNILRLTLRWFYGTREEVCRVIWGDLIEKVYINVAIVVSGAMNAFRRYVMSGNLGIYVLYILVAMFLTLIYVAGGVGNV